MTLSEVVATTLELIDNRKVSSDGKTVTYDLRRLRFSSRRIVSKTLCETLWKLDISRWMNNIEDISDFSPDTYLHLIVSEAQLPGMRKAIGKMMESLGRSNVDSYIKSFMQDINSSDSGLRAILLVGLAHGVLIQNGIIKKFASARIHDILEKLQEHIDIKQN